MLIFLLFVVEKLFEDVAQFFSWGFLKMFIHFLIIVGIVYGILTLRDIQYFFLSHPEIILVVLLLNILVGRFTGLQLVEYIRFIPLIRKLIDNKDEEEEEEEEEG